VAARSSPESVSEGRASRLPVALQSLKHRNYRLLWMGNLISQSGDWMDQVAFSWLVYDMTHSTVSLALVNVCRAGPILFFTLIGGVVADRFERRKLLFLTQFILMVLAFVLAGLMTFGLLQVWMAFAIAIGRGVTNSFNQPARQSLISDLVP
jgi:MFS family permease